jgi:hypothetical protein
MEKLKGSIVLESLENLEVLESLNVLSVREDEDWHIFSVEIAPQQIEELSTAIKQGWYMHFWSGDKMIVVFKEKTFEVNAHDASTWSEAIEYGKSIGIPAEQLDFVIE